MVIVIISNILFFFVSELGMRPFQVYYTDAALQIIYNYVMSHSSKYGSKENLFSAPS